MKAKLCSMLLVLAMLLSLVPTVAFAAEPTQLPAPTGLAWVTEQETIDGALLHPGYVKWNRVVEADNVYALEVYKEGAEIKQIQQTVSLQQHLRNGTIQSQKKRWQLRQICNWNLMKEAFAPHGIL